MPDIINLLPDSLANQIAAGEVVQRPASVVKELLENSIDAGGKCIRLTIQDAGKKLIQISDDGKGMTGTDARMAFERHATSKISDIRDLYKILTFGFRGEALASIAAVAQVELKTKPANSELGTEIFIEGSEVKKHEPSACPEGTIIAVKNLFYNTPARKNFLKSTQVEYRHILEEFTRVALSNPGIKFIFRNDKETIYHLNPGTLRQRIVQILGKKYDNALVPVEEKTPLLNIRGFIGKPEFARKKRGDQYFFTNGRFIKSPYLNHAIQGAYEKLLPSDAYPMYFLYFEIAPEKVDVNVHPTKTEIKFEDEKSIYAIIKASIKKALSQNHIAPNLDFEREESINPGPGRGTNNQEGLNFFTRPDTPHDNRFTGHSTGNDWKELMEVLTIRQEGNEKEDIPGDEELFEEEKPNASKLPTQIQGKYILTPIRSGFMIIHQHYAHQRILFEEYSEALEKNKSFSQQQLFPEVIELEKKDFELVKEMMEEIQSLGFSLEIFGKTAFLVNGIPSGIKMENLQQVFEQLLEDFTYHNQNKKLDRRESLALSLAKNSAIKVGKTLSTEEMTLIIDKLFACGMPYYTPDGKPVFITVTLDELDKKFEKRANNH